MGYHITRDRKTHGVKAGQHSCVKSMVEKFGVEKACGISAFSGMPTLSKVDEPQAPEEKEEVSKFPYREAEAVLMWTEAMTRPYIACAARAVARFCENPGLVHKKVVLKVMKYLLHTKE